MVIFREPASIYDEYRFNIRIEAPAGAVQSGALYFEHPDDSICWASVTPECCDNPTRVEGDFHCADSDLSPYAHAVFADVAYNGTWTFVIERPKSGKIGHEETGLEPLAEDLCMYLRVSGPDKTPREGGNKAESNCYRSGTVLFTWPDRWDDSDANVA